MNVNNNNKKKTDSVGQIGTSPSGVDIDGGAIIGGGRV